MGSYPPPSPQRVGFPPAREHGIEKCTLFGERALPGGELAFADLQSDGNLFVAERLALLGLRR